MPATPLWISLFLDVPLDAWTQSREFWPAATGTALSAPRGERDQFVSLLPPEGTSWVRLQAIEGPPRVHLDLGWADRDAGAERALALGASSAWQYDDVVVQRSPGGLLLCHAGGDPGRLARPGDSVLDQVCLDVPAEAWDTEVAFWHELTGRPLVAGLLSEFANLCDPSPDGPARILLQRLDEQSGEVRAHPDFAVADRPAEVARHVGLGARAGASYGDWTVLTAPDGTVYCLTDRDPRSGRIERG